MDNCAPFVFLGSWASVIFYSCFKFCIFNILVLEEYFFKLRAPHLFESCLCAVQDDFLLVVKEMHPFFNNLAIINAPSL